MSLPQSFHNVYSEKRLLYELMPEERGESHSFSKCVLGTTVGDGGSAGTEEVFLFVELSLVRV